MEISTEKTKILSFKGKNWYQVCIDNRILESNNKVY